MITKKEAKYLLCTQETQKDNNSLGLRLILILDSGYRPPKVWLHCLPLK